MFDDDGCYTEFRNWLTEKGVAKESIPSESEALSLTLQQFVEHLKREKVSEREKVSGTNGTAGSLGDLCLRSGSIDTAKNF